ncbi:hypothetical protein QBC33DRAFT_530329 [Phialemonium atrogriseum]|uniref:CmcJ-like methyltransferase n=1 Tax=Phialemonium atrogriseum TaxID=1093897 RepID=A0AAJ0FJQ4_9PEZI|nr:uncharacterized protein QBC33DRAFT_530329 [Phialemonium atrogriseum]KAK1770187.1 hypothetical protein QBC33DRAFT_530329 [Phialemonium atrogriseum]
MADTTVLGPEPQDIETFIPFLSKEDLYKVEKPYGADFPVDNIEGAKITNHIFDIHPVRVHDVRGSPHELDLERNGACFIKAGVSLKAEEASITMTPAMEKYIADVLTTLQKKFPGYVEIRLMDFQIRKRSVEFPHGHGKKVEFAQPATMPHTDFSVNGALMRMDDVFPNRKELYTGRDFDLLNIWKVLSGPNNDWPLAVCDYSSVDWDNDTTTNDAVHLLRTGENWLLHYNEEQQWYYLSGMEEDDLIVFRNTDSEGQRSRCFHVAFNNPSATGPPRESVEVRVAAFRN